MKKIVLFLVGMFLAISVQAKDAHFSLLVDSVAVAGTGAVYSNPVTVSMYDEFSYILQAHPSSATIGIELAYQIIDSNNSNYTLLGSTNDASVDGNFDTTYSSHNYQSEWIGVSGSSVLANLVASGKIAGTVTVPTTRFIRFRIQGQDSNEPTSGVTRASLTLGSYSGR